MLHGDGFGLLLGAVTLGVVHGVEPGHGWPVAATYALDRSNKWLYGFAASLILGIGHLISSLAMVAVFFYAKGYFDLARVDEPIAITGNVQIGGPVSLVAGVVLIALGVREYQHGRTHGTSIEDGSGRDLRHAHSTTTDTGHDHGHAHANTTDTGRHHHDDPPDSDQGPVGSASGGRDGDGKLARVAGALPFVGGHSHGGTSPAGAADRGLVGIAWFAFLLGFAHEEEFEIIALCAGSTYCLELMLSYAAAVIVGIVGLTMLLIEGYRHHEDRVRRLAPYLPTVSAVVLVVMGLGFVTGLF